MLKQKFISLYILTLRLHFLSLSRPLESNWATLRFLRSEVDTDYAVAFPSVALWDAQLHLHITTVCFVRFEDIKKLYYVTTNPIYKWVLRLWKYLYLGYALWTYYNVENRIYTTKLRTDFRRMVLIMVMIFYMLEIMKLTKVVKVLMTMTLQRSEQYMKELQS